MQEHPACHEPAVEAARRRREQELLAWTRREAHPTERNIVHPRLSDADALQLEAREPDVEQLVLARRRPLAMPASTSAATLEPRVESTRNMPHPTRDRLHERRGAEQRGDGSVLRRERGHERLREVERPGVGQRTYSASTTPEPPISLGRSRILGRPSFIGRTVSL